jgi:hypothetical protein
LLLVLTRFFIVPWLSGEATPSLADVIDQSLADMLATVVAATVLSAIVVWFTRPSKRPTELTVVHPKDIRPRLKQQLSDARTWWYSGSAGRWNRARVLPELAEKARQTNTSCDVVLSILDPRAEAACLAYAEYRRGVRTGADRDWTIEAVRRDLYATIVAAAVFNDEYPLLSVAVNLKKSTSILRVDSSDQGLVITREDPKEPGLVCEAGSYFFDTFRQNMVFERSQGDDLRLEPSGLRFESLDVAATRVLLEKLGFDTPELTDDSAVGAIVDEAKSRDSPY